MLSEMMSRVIPWWLKWMAAGALGGLLVMELVVIAAMIKFLVVGCA